MQFIGQCFETFDMHVCTFEQECILVQTCIQAYVHSDHKPRMLLLAAAKHMLGSLKDV